MWLGAATIVRIALPYGMRLRQDMRVGRFER